MDSNRPVRTVGMGRVAEEQIRVHTVAAELDIERAFRVAYTWIKSLIKFRKERTKLQLGGSRLVLAEHTDLGWGLVDQVRLEGVVAAWSVLSTNPSFHGCVRSRNPESSSSSAPKDWQSLDKT